MVHIISRFLRSPLRSGWGRCLADLLVTTSQEFFTDVSSRVCQMVPIGSLSCLRGTFPRCGGRILPAVTAPHINRWMRLHPSLGRFRLPLGQQIETPRGRDSDENDSDTTSPTEAPIIQTEQ